ncbi:sulfotransferase domain-containing protein [Crocosphaera sp. Alani8]|uniref:sulfotransferase domain-containing protein n=1 Tax=Crocosphaera sp. Alani8 TaxID=3038952 RepID=UPI00313E4F49
MKSQVKNFLNPYLTSRQRNSVLIYTIHKAASTFLYKLTFDITNLLSLNYYSTDGKDERVKKVIGHDYNYVINKEIACFGPIRGSRELSFPENLEEYSIILHLRDPRDVLTSLFYSFSYSHVREEGKFNPTDEQREQWVKEGVDKFVTNTAPGIKERYEIYCNNLLNRENVVFIKYEDMVYEYDKWLKEFLSAFYYTNHKNLGTSNFLDYHNILFEIYKKFIFTKLYRKYKTQFKVSKERIYKHKRQITPGDHKRKLSPETIEFLNYEFKDILNLLKYEV